MFVLLRDALCIGMVIETANRAIYPGSVRYIYAAPFVGKNLGPRLLVSNEVRVCRKLKQTPPVHYTLSFNL